MSDDGFTIHWEVGKGADCPTCRRPIERAMRIKLGSDNVHRLDLETARDLGQTLIAYVERIEAKR